MFDNADIIYDSLSEKFPKEAKIRQAIFDHYFVYLKDYYMSFEYVSEALFEFPDNKALLNRKMIVMFVLGKRKQAFEILHVLLEDDSFDREQTIELYPQLFEDPSFTELIKS